MVMTQHLRAWTHEYASAHYVETHVEAHDSVGVYEAWVQEMRDAYHVAIRDLGEE